MRKIRKSRKNTNSISRWGGILLLLLLLTAAGCAPRQAGGGETVYFTFTADPVGANSYIVANGGEAAVIDTAAAPQVVAALREKKLNPRYLLLTHGHFDHIWGVDLIRREFPGISVMISPLDRDMLADPVKNLSAAFGSQTAVAVEAKPLEPGTVLRLGGATCRITATPGHSPGSVSIHTDGLLFTGDTLFKGSVGRTDFPGGDAAVLNRSLTKLARFPDNTIVLPGHGEATTIGAEKRAISGEW